MNGTGLIGVLMALNSLRQEEEQVRKEAEDDSFYRDLSRIDALSAKIDGPSTELETLLHYFERLQKANSGKVFSELDAMM